MKSAIIVLVLGFLSFGSVSGETPIPAESKQAMDFRGKSYLTQEAYEKLFKCKTYEALRDQLKVAIDTIVVDCAAAGYAVATCQFALIRTNYILGDVKTADALFMKMHPVNATAPARKEDPKQQKSSQLGQERR